MKKILVLCCLAMGIAGCDETTSFSIDDDMPNAFKVITVAANGETHEYLEKDGYGPTKSFCHLPNCKYCKGTKHE